MGVMLQNCELALELMADMEQMFAKMEHMDPNFRLFITCLPHKDFPLGLLQMSTKVTNEPPMGLKAGLLRTYTVTVDQERLERVETEQWRKLLFGLSFLHSVVQERRKFGAIGWCIKYEYNTADLTACILFLEGHLYAGPISWSTLQYMVSEVQYGGKITDSVDRRMFNTYAEELLLPPGESGHAHPAELQVHRARPYGAQTLQGLHRDLPRSRFSGNQWIAPERRIDLPHQRSERDDRDARRNATEGRRRRRRVIEGAVTRKATEL